MKVCIAGKNNIAVDILLYLIDKGINKKNIYIIPNKTDTKEDNWQRSLYKKTEELGIHIVNLEEVYKIENMIFLSLEFDEIIKPLNFNTNKLFNIHFSLLPKYKGMFTSIIPILNNEKYTGVTFHKIDKGIDTGDIIEQAKFSIDIMDNARDVYTKYIECGTSLVKKNVDKLLRNDYLECKSQNILESTYYSNKVINFSNIVINLNQTSLNIHNQIRAYNFREYQVPKIFNTPIISSKFLNSCSKLKAGKIICENDISFVISTVDNDIVLYKDRVDELFIACKNNSYELVNRLIQIPKIVNTQNKYGWTPLIVAIFNNHKDIIKALLIHGSDLLICNFKGTTPLMYAKSSFVKHNDSEILKLLLTFDADIYQKDYQNKNILDYCIESNEEKVLNIIKR